MSKQIEALKLALEALEPRPGMPNPEYESLMQCAITSIKKALAEQPASKPLKDEQIREASLQAGMQEHYMGFHSGFIRFARVIEAAHGINEEGGES